MNHNNEKIRLNINFQNIGHSSIWEFLLDDLIDKSLNIKDKDVKND